MNKILAIIPLILFSLIGNSQVAPSDYENIDYLITFSKGASIKWGDDDFTQSHFFVIPKNETKPIYIRVFDPSTSGLNDTKNGVYDSKTSFSVYGGKGAHSNLAARKINPVLGYDSGQLIATKTFGNELKYDQNWYTFGPFNPKEGEYSKEFGGYVFKVICKGLTGNDGNAFKYSLSYNKEKNVFVENGNIFTYEMSFKLGKNNNTAAHIYPFITSNIKSILLYNFDADNDIFIRVTSIARKLVNAKVSSDGNWAKNIFYVLEKEVNTSIDIQFIKKTGSNNDMTVFLLNQFKEAIPLFTSPIGGKPVYQYKVDLEYKF
ncbi:MAG: hypothetical protein ACWA41_09370 [Putridiphycobacter sp.]